MNIGFHCVCKVNILLNCSLCKVICSEVQCCYNSSQAHMLLHKQKSPEGSLQPVPPTATPPSPLHSKPPTFSHSTDKQVMISRPFTEHLDLYIVSRKNQYITIELFHDMFISPRFALLSGPRCPTIAPACPHAHRPY